MKELINRLSQPTKKESFIRFELEGRISKDLLPQFIPWILSVSFFGGIVGIFNILHSSNSEMTNDSAQIESVKQSSNSEKSN